MKKLIIVRHAKSSWKSNVVNDHDRPLNDRGQRDAPKMGRRLKERGTKPELLICSSARRAMDTAFLLAGQLGYPSTAIEPDANLYDATPDTWLSRIAALPTAIDVALLVGHNPELTELVNRLAPVSIDNVPTCGVLELVYATDDWAEVLASAPESWFFDYPKK